MDCKTPPLTRSARRWTKKWTTFASLMRFLLYQLHSIHSMHTECRENVACAPGKAREGAWTDTLTPSGGYTQYIYMPFGLSLEFRLWERWRPRDRNWIAYTQTHTHRIFAFMLHRSMMMCPADECICLHKSLRRCFSHSFTGWIPQW